MIGYTGQRFLGNYSNDEAQYLALMNSGLTFAKAHNLREGIALSAEQIATLTTDIVWMEQQTVTLPGVDGMPGTTTTALVPRVYAVLQNGDLSPGGALLAGNTIDINTASGDINNTGTIAGRKLVNMAAANINNTVGSISAQTVALKASKDINILGGSVVADFELSAVADNDLNVTSTTQSSQGTSTGGAYQFSQSGVDRVAGLYTRGPGTLLASAGNNLTLTAAQINGAGDVKIAAGNNLKLDTVNTSRSDNFNAGNADNHFLSSSSKEQGTSITSKGNTSLAAGNTLQMTAAQVKANGDLKINATNIALLAGISKANSESVMTNTSGGFLSSTTTVTKESHASATAQVNQLTGKNLTITAERDLVSVGSKFAAIGTTDGTPSGNLTVEGKNSQTFYAAKDVTQSDKSVESTTSMFGGMINLGTRSSTDSRTQQISIATQLESTQAINVRVGNSATFEGANLTANTITFTKTDPAKAGVVNLLGSIDTTQTSHTEKSETLGVYQSASGTGSTIQTLNLTKLNTGTTTGTTTGTNGEVTFDKALQVAVQVPKTITTSGDKANTAAASNATNTTSQANVQSQIDQLSKQPGLGYLSQLSSNAAKTNPTQWSQVQLAHDKWSYSQQGLTPAGAALLSIAVAAYAPGLSASVAGSITATAGASAAAAASAGFAALQAQAAVAMVNNGGDIGKTLQQLGSEQSVKALLTTMATAGALSQLNETLGFNGQSGPGASGNSGITTGQATNAFQQNLLKNVTNNVAGSAIDAAISGKAFDEKTLSTALSNALITAGMAQGANSIGDAKLNTFTSSVAHAALGCVSGAVIAGNGGGCSAGAVGAVVGELSSSYALNKGMSDKDAAAFAKVMAATSGLLAGGGGDNAAAVNIANTTGANAAEYNRLLHKTESQQAAQLAKTSGGRFTQKQIEDAMRNSGNTALDETVTTGMVNPGTNVEDKGAVFQNTGTAIVQVLPNASKVSPDLAAFIVANTGGANSPYSWLDVQTGKITTSVNPNAGLNIVTPNANGCVTAECAAGISSGKATMPDGSYGVGLYTPLIGGEIEIELKNGEAVGGKVGIGAGLGGHVNVGTKSIGGAQLLGPVVGYKTSPVDEVNPMAESKVRVGSSVTLGVGLGSVGVEGMVSGGVEGNESSTNGFVSSAAGNVTISPVLPKMQGEIKVNLIEINVKPPVETSK